MNLTGSPFIPGPVPRNSLAPVTGPDALYSGLLECPVTTRIKKNLEGSSGFEDSFAVQAFSCNTQPSVPSCEHLVGTAAGCFAAIKQLPALSNFSITGYQNTSSPLQPAGCSIIADAYHKVASALFNPNLASSACCGVSPTTQLDGSTHSRW